MDGLPRAITIASLILASALVAYGWMVQTPRYTFQILSDGTVWTQDTKTGALCLVLDYPTGLEETCRQ